MVSFEGAFALGPKLSVSGALETLRPKPVSNAAFGSPATPKVPHEITCFGLK